MALETGMGDSIFQAAVVTGMILGGTWRNVNIFSISAVDEKKCKWNVSPLIS